MGCSKESRERYHGPELPCVCKANYDEKKDMGRTHKSRFNFCEIAGNQSQGRKQMAHPVKKELMTGSNKRKFAIDSIACAIFWTLVYIPIFLYTSKSAQLALVGLGSAALVEILFGGLYGKYLDLVRKRFGFAPKVDTEANLSKFPKS